MHKNQKILSPQTGWPIPFGPLFRALRLEERLKRYGPPCAHKNCKGLHVPTMHKNQRIVSPYTHKNQRMRLNHNALKSELVFWTLLIIRMNFELFDCLKPFYFLTRPQGHTLPHWNALRYGKYELKGLSCNSSLDICHNIMKSAILLHKQGFGDSQQNSTVCSKTSQKLSKLIKKQTFTVLLKPNVI